MPILIILVGIFATFLYYVYYKYQRSRNQHLFFKTSVHRPLLWAIGILLSAPIITNLLFPDTHLNLSTLNHARVDQNLLQQLLGSGQIFSYYLNILEVIWLNINYSGFISATLILVTWFIYINRIDFFNKEKPLSLLVTLFLGMLFSILTFLISDGLNLIYPFDLNGHFFHDLFISSFAGIGLVEEFVKLIPVLIILKWTKNIDEPFDYILYASISALGFAFIENLSYFREVDNNIVTGRAFTSVVGHMIFSSVCIYGLVLAKYNYKKKAGKYLLYSFLAGAFLHGFYDFLLFKNSIIFFFLFFIFALQSWTVIINNTINNSNFFDYKIAFQAIKHRQFLAIMLASILALGYFIHALQFGKEIANQNFIATCIFGGFFLIFYITSLSNFDLVKGYWRPIKLQFSSPNPSQLPGNRGLGSLISVFKYNYILPVNLVHYEIGLRPPHYNQVLYGTIGEISGEIVDRICLTNQHKTTGINYIETDWFVVALHQHLPSNSFSVGHYINTHVLLRLEDKTDSLLHDTDVRGYLRLIPNREILNEHQPEKGYFPYAGYILVNGIAVPGEF